MGKNFTSTVFAFEHENFKNWPGVVADELVVAPPTRFPPRGFMHEYARLETRRL